VRRIPTTVFAASFAVLLGMAGLVRGSVPQSGASDSPASAATPIVVGGAYVREPATPENAAAYFTVYNNTDAPDVLTTVTSGAGGTTSLHSDGPTGSMVLNAGGLTIPAHSQVSLSPGQGHVMIEQLYGPLRPGQTVNLQLQFQTNGLILVTAPVIAIGAPAPTAGPTAGSSATSSASPSASPTVSPK